MRLSSERGAIAIILVAIILTIMFVIGITASTVRLKRLRFANQNAIVTRTEEAVKTTKDFVIDSINSSHSTTTVYTVDGDGDCASSWLAVEDTWYCLKDLGLVPHPRYPGTNPDVQKYELKVKLLNEDIIQSAIFFVNLNGSAVLL